MSLPEIGAWMIMQEALKGLLVLAAAALAAAAMRRSPAAWRHQLWALALLALLALPALSVLLPAWQPPAIPAWNTLATTSEPSSSDQAEQFSSKVNMRLTPESAAVETQRAQDISSHSRVRSSRLRLGWLAWIWLGGFACAGLRLLRQGIQLRRLLRSGALWQRPDALRLLEEQRRTLGMGKSIQLRISPAAPLPMAFGLRRNCIMLPAEAVEWSPHRLRVVLLHECAHLARRDPLFNLAGELSGLLHWFNPLLWLALRRMRLESERASDDVVLGSGVPPRLYAQVLLDCVRRMRADASWLAIPAAMADRSGLKRRLRSILDPQAPRQGRNGRAGRIAFCLACMLLVPLASLRLWRAEPASAADRPPREASGSLQQVMAALDAPDDQLRKRAAWVLGEREDRRAVQRLIQALQDPDPEVRAMVSWALGEIKDPRALQPLQAALEDPDANDREMAAMALGELEDRRAVPALTRLFADPAADVRIAAVWALGEIGSRQAWQQVIRSLADPAVGVRWQAAEVLGRRRTREALPDLLESLSDGDSSVRAQSAASLGLLGDSQALPGLLDSLQDPDPRVRRESATALGRIGDPRSVDALIQALRDPQALVRAQAVWALDEISEWEAHDTTQFE